MTYAEHFLLKFPNAMRCGYIKEIPVVCRRRVYGNLKKCNRNCKTCWLTQIPIVKKGE